VSGLLRLYPRRWRDRYGEEFEALLADRPPTPRHRLDIVRGAFDAHLHPQLVDPDRVGDRWWLVPLAGLGLFVIGVLLMVAAPERYDAYGSYRESSLALVPFLGSVVLLLAGIARFAMLLPPEPGALRVIASIGVSAGVLWAIAPWTGILGATFFGATALVAVGAWRTDVIPGRLAAALVVALSGPTVLFLATMVLPWYWLRQAGVSAFVLFGMVVLVWPLVALCLRSASRAAWHRAGATLPAA
jgi:hypothetical protein